MTLLNCLSMGDVVRTHLKTQQRTFADALKNGKSLGESDVRRIMFKGYDGSLPSRISEWLSKNIGESTRYWCKVNKKTGINYGYWSVLNKIVDLAQFKEWIYDKTDEEPKVEVDTEISAKTVLGMNLLYPERIDKFTMTVSKGALIQEPPSLQSCYVRILWLLLRKLSTQEDRNAMTELNGLEMLENEGCYNSANYLGNYYAKFRIDNTDFWVRPFKTVGTNRTEPYGLIAGWSKDFLEIMNLEISSVNLDGIDDVFWKHYV